MNEMEERVARAMWEVRRLKAGEASIELEEWGDGSIPRLNHIMEEARAAIEVILEEARSLTDMGGDIALHELEAALK